MSDLSKRMSQQDLLLGCWVTVGHPVISELLADAGFDWLAIDMEHSAITLAEAQILMQSMRATPCSPLVRVGANDPVQIKRVLDAGAHGIIVPMVNSRDDAERAVAASRYPLAGMRGVGLARAQKYGFDFEGYREGLQKNIVVIAQIEHIDAINAIDDILATPGLTGSIIGPYDLSGSLGIPGELDHPSVVEAVEKYEQACVRAGMPSGYHVVPPEEALVRQRVSRGYTFVGLSLDTLLLGTAARHLLATARAAGQDSGRVPK